MYVSVILSLVFLLSGCSDAAPGYKISFRENTCIKELNKQYRDLERAPSSVYKLEKIVKEEKGPKLKVSVWHNNSWYYQGAKKYTYFKNTKLFAYKYTNCPDNSGSGAAFGDKIKSMDIAR